MIGIKGVATYVPDTYIDNVKKASDFGETEEFLRNRIGALWLPRKSQEQDTSDLCVAAISNLFSKYPVIDQSSIGALVVVTQNPDGEGLPHTSAVVQDKLKLANTVAAFDISLGCSGYVYGLFVLKGFMEASGLSSGLLVTADPYSKIVDQTDRSTSLLFGDAATATWLGTDPGWTLDAVSYGTDGGGASYLCKENSRLSMNGRRVYNFAASNIDGQIRSLLRREGLSVEDIDLFILHQGSVGILDVISKKFGKYAHRFPIEMEKTGNTVSSSIPLLLEAFVHDTTKSRIILSGFGVGLSWASAVISRSC